MTLTTTIKDFHLLSPLEVYHILQLRSEVFVVEQKCIFLDADNKDPDCAHVMIVMDDKLVATARLVPPGLSYPEMSIGRVVTHPSARRTGVGKILMDKSLKYLYKKFGAAPVKIGAQFYLRNFYGGFGFVQSSEIYDEDGIDHIEMIKKNP
jgi:ElaA protein